MSIQSRRKYDPEFEKNAVLLAKEPDRSVSDVAENLGSKIDLLYRLATTFPRQWGNALTLEQKRIRELEKKLKDAEMERDILKKAMAIFSKTSR